jgi:hypothetical protein
MRKSLIVKSCDNGDILQSGKLALGLFQKNNAGGDKNEIR